MKEQMVMTFILGLLKFCLKSLLMVITGFRLQLTTATVLQPISPKTAMKALFQILCKVQK